jgi:hypothetical protein
MNSKHAIVVTISLALSFAGVGFANQICSFDPVPSVSLLFPYIVYDYSGTTTTNTLIAITNTGSEAQIVHITLWSDYSFPVLDFNVVLSGYDMETINIRDILEFGDLPITGTQGSLIINGPAPGEDGPVSHSDGAWLDNIMPDSDGTNSLLVRCPPSSGAYPGHYAIGLDSGDLDILEFYFTISQLSTKMHNDCVGTTYDLSPTPSWWQLRSGSEPTWIYGTADVVWECNRLFPDQPAYWTTQAMYDNVLIGDVFWVDDVANFSEAGNAVHLQADQQIAEVVTLDSTGNPITFYYRYSTRNLVTPDYREPLPTAWALRYVGVEESDMDTHIRAWKGSTFSTTVADLYIPSGFVGTYLAYDCWAYTYWAWDEDEMVATVDESPWSIPGVVDVFPNLLPLETQEVLADEFNTPGPDGWFLFVWPNSNWDGLASTPAPDWYQTWMGVRYSAFGKFSAYLDGSIMGNFNCYSNQVLPNLGIDYDYVVSPGGYVSSPPYAGPKRGTAEETADE